MDSNVHFCPESGQSGAAVRRLADEPVVARAEIGDNSATVVAI
ncbi:MAG: hypothetical protein R3D89_11200 [Sphingomonadaceae bacterium]